MPGSSSDGPSPAPPALDRWRRAAAIVYAALDLRGETRDRLVGERCAGDAVLEAEVRRWLAAADEPAPLLTGSPLPAHPALSPLSPLSPLDGGERRPSADEGARIGPWRILRVVGTGGMGEVYEAERADGAFVRRVALEVACAVPERALLVRRFLREREILAALDHPNIARLLDGGVTAEGAPYYVMELVDGERSTRTATGGGSTCARASRSCGRCARRWPTRTGGWWCTAT